MAVGSRHNIDLAKHPQIFLFLSHYTQYMTVCLYVLAVVFSTFNIHRFPLIVSVYPPSSAGYSSCVCVCVTTYSPTEQYVASKSILVTFT